MPFVRLEVKIVCIILLFVFVPLMVFPKGQRENRLLEAEQLIEARRYNDAILIITKVMQEEPDRFEQAEALIGKIRLARIKYNQVYAELIDVYDSGDLAKAYEIIQDLEDLDRAPDKTTAQSLVTARETAGFVYNQQRFIAVMEAAEKENREGRYGAAVDAYLTGFDISRDIFDMENYGNVVVSQVDRETGKIADTAIRLKRGFENLADLELRINGQLEADNFADLSETLAEYGSVFLQIHRDRKLAYDSAILLRVLGETLQAQRQAGKEVFHLSYLYYLTLGRSRAETDEGIVGSLDLAARSSHASVSDSFWKKISEKVEEGNTNLKSGAFLEAADYFSAAIGYSEQAARLYGLWGSRLYLDKKFDLPRQSREVLTAFLPELWEAVSLTSILSHKIAYADMNLAYTELNASIDQSFQENELILLRRLLLDLRGELSGNISGLSAGISKLNEFSSKGYDIPKSRELSAEILSDYQSFDMILGRAETETVAKLYNLRNETLDTGLGPLYGNVETAKNYMAGVSQDIRIGNITETLLVKYPDRARDLLTQTRTLLNSLSASADRIISGIAAEGAAVRTAASVTAQDSRARELKNRITELNASIPALLTQAEELIFMGNRYRQEALDRISEAEVLLRRNDFQRAEERLKQAVERLDLSLSYQEDEALRILRDSRVPEISRDINRAANEQVIRDVRRLITEGRSLYSQGAFQRAQNTFLNAQSRWKSTNPEPNTEIETWLEYVNTALSIESGRIISETDPLHGEMIGYLNAALVRYNEGRTLLNRGQRERALSLFEEAKQMIFLVQQPFPLNKEAGVLYLRILQLSDPSDFTQYFRNKYNEAVAKIQLNPQEALIELQDLKEINPTYSGIDNSIIRAEIAAGIRIPPPDPEALRRSRQLYNDAFEIVRNNIRAQFPLALEYLDAAIRLNPDNNDAISLKDRINRDAGGSVTVVLSTAAMESYREAEDLFLQRRYIEAGIIIDRLLADPRYSRNPQLIELKRSIDSRR